jgi:hypothetical protein
MGGKNSALPGSAERKEKEEKEKENNNNNNNNKKRSKNNKSPKLCLGDLNILRTVNTVYKGP